MDSVFKSCSIGIMAYNEGRNISKLLGSIEIQSLRSIKINEIIIVASGCSDDTENVIENYKSKNPQIKLLHQDKREGKASAINLFLKNAVSDILVISSADILWEINALEELLAPFQNRQVGMTGARCIPIDNENNTMSSLNKLRWDIHHTLSLKYPKLGELIAIRKSFDSIPSDTIVDEETIECIVRRNGHTIVYCPSAVIYNKGPKTIIDFLKQRSRNYAGRFHLLATLGYRCSSFRFSSILQALRDLEFKPAEIYIFFLLVMQELISLIIGFYLYATNRDKMTIWPVAESTKTLLYD